MSLCIDLFGESRLALGNDNGTGLGLMVVYRIVTQHRGSIQVDSTSGEGASFVITLPVAERPIRLLDEPPKAGATQPN